METTSKGVAKIASVRIRGFRSLADVELSGLSDATVLIGANGSGKSNFIRFFEMLRWMLRSRQLGEFVERQGGADDQLYGGNTTTPRMQAEILLRTERGRNDYRFALSYAHPDRLIFTEEAFRFHSNTVSTEAPWQYLGSGYREAEIVEAAHSANPANGTTSIRRPLGSSSICCEAAPSISFTTHPIAQTSRSGGTLEDNNTLRTHGGNLAAILHRLEHEDIKRFEMICRHINRILPVFDRFQIEESYGKVSLRWKAKGMDKTFGAHLTSDGSLRFFALVTLLNLPSEMLPAILLLDEPELGLHPAAVALVGGMIKALAEKKQVIVATQSPLLVDAFDLNEIVVVELRDGQTQSKRLDPDAYRVWLDDNFTTGELWQKNLLGGRP